MNKRDFDYFFHIGDKWTPLYLDLHSFHFLILLAKFYVGLTIFSGFCQYKNHHYPSFMTPKSSQSFSNTCPYHDKNEETWVF